MIVDEKFCFKEETSLTVHKTSVFFPGDGFLVYDPNREIILRFDSYGPDSEPKDELVLMDASGKGLLTLHRKKPSLRQRSSIIARSNLVVEVSGDPGEEYHIRGSYSKRRCAVFNTSSENSSKELVAVIKRKVDPTTHVMLGKDVFWLCVRPGFDGAFAMGLVLVLDQMYGDTADGDVREVDPTSEDFSS
ncbi:hypothetical protein OIU79_012952 [Salix purpurea]|uniref:Uncharacterized protein n=1 Tax=Salix purpurea TaxID=77065 RepID=A0A9Q0Q4F2_SALPP|nr:hypothetical protein OIU79_012952 [Salix purpurea]